MLPFKFEIGQRVNVRPNPKHMVSDWVQKIDNLPGVIKERNLIVGSNKYKSILIGLSVANGKYPDKNRYMVQFDAPIELEVRITMDTMHFDEDELV